MRVLAPGKINLHLRVGRRRDDGFHPLFSWMVSVGLFDRLIVKRRPIDPGSGDLLTLACDQANLPTDGRNLVVKAANALADAAGWDGKSVGFQAQLLKAIPHGAGLGGGSSDAAATLVALNHLLGLNWSTEQLAGVADKVGSDVPFFLGKSSAIVEGKGERVRPTPRPIVKAAILMLPAFGVSTADCYRQFDAMNLGTPEGNLTDPGFANWATLPAKQLMGKLVNDLEPPAFVLQPRLAMFRQQAEDLAGRPVRMSGSGSALFTLADTLAEAGELSGKLSTTMGVKSLAVEIAPGGNENAGPYRK